ncbi:MAG: acyl-CoA synthetase [Rubrivivax sp.]
MRDTPAPAWAKARERSNVLAIRAIAWIALHLGRPIARGVLHFITLYFLLFAPQPRRHSQRYLRRALGRAPTWADSYRHFHRFASVALDRIWFVKGQLGVFKLQVGCGKELMLGTMAEGRGAFLLGAHAGSFEALSAFGDSCPGMRVAMVMYPENARKIHSVLAAIAPDFEMGIITIGQRGSTLAIRDWLDGNGLVGLMGDRYLVGDVANRSNRVMLPFLGQPAPFSDGPLRLAQLLKRRVVFMVGLYHGGNHYELRFEELADFREAPSDAAAREAALQQALQAYAAKLEALCRETPYNWFNFYDYWHEDAQDAPPP